MMIWPREWVREFLSAVTWTGLGDPPRIGKELYCTFHGHQIGMRIFDRPFSRFDHALSNRWCKAELYIDGKVVDAKTSKTLVSEDISSDVPFLRGNLELNGDVHVIEVYARHFIFRFKQKICIDGIKVAGNLD